MARSFLLALVVVLTMLLAHHTAAHDRSSSRPTAAACIALSASGLYPVQWRQPLWPRWIRPSSRPSPRRGGDAPTGVSHCAGEPARL